MKRLNEFVKADDWKNEKHVPAIEAPATAKAGDWVEISVTVGKDIPHPNTTEHHMSWIALHFVPEGAKLSYELGRFEFSAHGQSAKGANEGPVYTDSRVTVRVRLLTSGTIYATTYCNIHGLWESSRNITLA